MIYFSNITLDIHITGWWILHMGGLDLWGLTLPELQESHADLSLGGFDWLQRLVRCLV
jgi:hypothetical protein